MSEAAPAPAYRFAASQAALVFLAYIGAQFITGFVVGVAWFAFGREQGARLAPEMVAKATLAGGALGLIAGGAMVHWLARRAVRRDSQGLTFDALGWTAAPPRAQFFALLGGVLIGIGFIAATFVFPLPDNWQPGLMARAVGQGGWPLYLWAFLALAIAPPVEEFVFRGVLWAGFRRSWGPVAAGIAVTAAFVAIHLPEAGSYFPAMLSITAMGIAALAARIASGSLVPPMLVHFGYNAIVVGATLSGSAG